MKLTKPQVIALSALLDAVSLLCVECTESDEFNDFVSNMGLFKLSMDEFQPAVSPFESGWDVIEGGAKTAEEWEAEGKLVHRNCGSIVVKSDISDYDFTCHQCDEDLYTVETSVNR